MLNPLLRALPSLILFTQTASIPPAVCSVNDSPQVCSSEEAVSRCTSDSAHYLQTQLIAQTPPPVYRLASVSLEFKEPEPSPSPLSEPTPESTPTSVPTPTPTPDSTPEPIPESTPASGSRLNSQVLFQLVNDHRQAQNLPPFQESPELCQIAHNRAPELDNEIFGDSYIHAGFDALNLDFRVTENMISQETEAAALNWWLNSSIHRKAILSGASHACVSCGGRSCAMLFSSFEPK